MSLLDAIIFFGLMLGLAALPSASVALVVARSAALGVRNGLAVAAGIVCGDLAFIALALLGMQALAETLGGLFAVVKMAAGGYLIWFGWQVFRSKPGSGSLVDRSEAGPGSLCASFLAGFFLTLGDLKAILFYASLFPAFLDLETLRLLDVGWIVACTVGAVGGVKAAYALLAGRLVDCWAGCSASRGLRRGAGAVLMGTGAWVVTRS